MNHSKILSKRMYDVIAVYANVIANDIKTNWDKNPQIEGKAILENPEITSLVEGEIIYNLFASGQKAWIMEYGSGSRMDRENPHLKEYIRSDIFNRYRKKNGLAITGRKEGEYLDLDGNKHYSTGKKAGRVIESKNNPFSNFYSYEGQAVIKNAVEGMLEKIIMALADVMVMYEFELLFPQKIEL